MPQTRHLTKSRFKIGHECPTKLFYLDDNTYGNTKVEDSFLEALAAGGFQVGELAKIYYPGGVDIKTLDKQAALQETNELLEKESVVIYEAAIQYQNLFIRADILVKKDNRIEIIEVKAKSYDSEEDHFLTKTKKPKLNSAWEPYLMDVAFQAYVLKNAFPQYSVTGALMLADKSQKASIDGINQKFFLEKQNGHTSVKVNENTTKDSLGNPLLIKVSVEEEINFIWQSTYEVDGKMFSFSEYIHFLEDICVNRKFLNPPVSAQCKKCEFRIDQDLKAEGKKSGFENCWKKARHLKSADFDRPFIFDIWNFRKSDALINNGAFFMDQLTKDDFASGSSAERQWLQVKKVQEKDETPFLDSEGLSSEMESWKYPLHFIDFETTMVAIPFHKGRRPYEQIAFQFSHQQVDESGKISHKDEYINRERGKFPNFDFLRALKKALEKDEGTIFRYSNHENTVLNQIKEQLLTSEEEIPERDELIRFIESITTHKNSEGKVISGPRTMIDLCELVKSYYYHPKMKGSNSIKAVLPAVLNSSEFLQQKYSQPIYGASGEIDGIFSHNFNNHSWIEVDQEGKIKDPYQLLPPVFSDISNESLDTVIIDGQIADGGAAMTAYARMQFTEMSDEESDLVAKALLKYCELDTLAMVMIYEYWKSKISR
ncbi:MAG: DUF2779 domain-containing protein [Oligoflexia bacterium]|nr:DUF2779 domain-containing protein [Oligoflexia bacterium]